VQHRFYEELWESASAETQTAERKFNENYKNYSRGKLSPLSKKANELYKKYLQLFIKKGLIQKPEKMRMSDTEYPRLKAYNYLNDPEIYRVTPAGHGRELI